MNTARLKRLGSTSRAFIDKDISKTITAGDFGWYSGASVRFKQTPAKAQTTHSAAANERANAAFFRKRDPARTDKTGKSRASITPIHALTGLWLKKQYKTAGRMKMKAHGRKTINSIIPPLF